MIGTNSQAWEQKVRSTKTVSKGRLQFKRSTAYDIPITSPMAARPSKRARTEAIGEYEDAEVPPSGPSAHGDEEKEGDDIMPFSGPTEEAT